MVKDLIDKDIEETNNKPKGVRGESIRRILAELADFFVCFVLAITFYGVAFQKLFGFEKYSSQMREISDQQTSIFLEHRL